MKYTQRLQPKQRRGGSGTTAIVLERERTRKEERGKRREKGEEKEKKREGGSRECKERREDSEWWMEKGEREVKNNIGREIWRKENKSGENGEGEMEKGDGKRKMPY